MSDLKAQELVTEFALDPVGAMERHPVKLTRDNLAVETSSTAFSSEDIEDRAFIHHRDQVRQTLQTVVDGVVISLEEVLPGRAPIEMTDRPENLVDAVELRALSSMEDAELRKAELDETPWSDDYWAIYLGILGRRYADNQYPNSEDWEENYEYIRDNPLGAIAKSGDAYAIDLLSPSEKYDLLVGDRMGTLTQKMWDEGKRYFDRYGRVESWMGICHGWAPAAYMLPRPERTVRVLAADNETELQFYPSDIKALASLLWAKARTVSRLIGGRCNDKNPDIDEETGRVLSSRCFDTNPGTWHQVVVNQIGVHRKSFIIDATFDYEVWNQPVFGYEYWYFNPRTWSMETSLAAASIPRAELSEDRFRAYRSPDAETIVGVVMKVTYIVETSPSHEDTDHPDKDARHTVYYLYDLELDTMGDIVGGEWYMNKHPDFLWTPPLNARAVTPADQLAEGMWDDGAEPIPQTWRRAAQSAARHSMPLAKIVESLIRQSRR